MKALLVVLALAATVACGGTTKGTPMDDDNTYCGCGESKHTTETCPEDGYGPLSKQCKASPGSKFCECPGDNPEAGQPDDGDDRKRPSGGGW